MASRVIKDSETDATSTFVFGGDLLEIDGPGSLQTPAILAQNGATFTMTAGATLTVTGAPDMDPVRRDTQGRRLKAIGRPKISDATEAAIKKRLAAGIGMLKVAHELGVGSGTVQRVKREMAIVPQP